MKIKKTKKDEYGYHLAISIEELNYFITENGGLQNNSPENIKSLTMQFLNNKVGGKILNAKFISENSTTLNIRYVLEKPSKLKLA